jgi:hypothetical protein
LKKVEKKVGKKTEKRLRKKLEKSFFLKLQKSCAPHPYPEIFSTSFLPSPNILGLGDGILGIAFYGCRVGDGFGILGVGGGNTASPKWQKVGSYNEV